MAFVLKLCFNFSLCRQPGRLLPVDDQELLDSFHSIRRLIARVSDYLWAAYLELTDAFTGSVGIKQALYSLDLHALIPRTSEHFYLF